MQESYTIRVSKFFDFPSFALSSREANGHLLAARTCFGIASSLFYAGELDVEFASEEGDDPAGGGTDQEAAVFGGDTDYDNAAKLAEMLGKLHRRMKETGSHQLGAKAMEGERLRRNRSFRLARGTSLFTDT